MLYTLEQMASQTPPLALYPEVCRTKLPDSGVALNVAGKTLILTLERLIRLKGNIKKKLSVFAFAKYSRAFWL